MKNQPGVSYDISYRKIFTHLKKFLSVSDELIEEICERSQLKVFNNKEIILSEGRHSNTLFFILKGFCICYYCDKNGRENIMQFIEEGKFCFLHHSFFGKEKSLFNIRATEKTTLLCISRENYNYLWNHYHDFVHLICNIHKQYAIESELHYYRMRSLVAEERIRHALETREIQSLMQHVPQYYIASYLNMAPETYAKLIANLNKNMK